MRQDVDGESSSRRMARGVRGKRGPCDGKRGGCSRATGPIAGARPGERDRRDFFRRPIPDEPSRQWAWWRSSVTKLWRPVQWWPPSWGRPGSVKGPPAAMLQIGQLGKVLSEAIGHGGGCDVDSTRNVPLVGGIFEPADGRGELTAKASRLRARGGMAGGPLGVAGGLPASLPGGRPANAKPQISRLARTSRLYLRASGPRAGPSRPWLDS